MGSYWISCFSGGEYGHDSCTFEMMEVDQSTCLLTSQCTIGKEPLRLLLSDKSRVCKLCNWRTFSGNVPIKLQEARFITVKLLIFAKKSGIGALRLFEASQITESYCTFPRESSNGPES
ncbi:hypothetical protein Tco_0940593 [Tanacetum coccineum]|uniref:Uncharacterized protein n=1 Tax=Tanacetum coccineum TaxID=301880 RepID=A0ABQ5DQ62_9ASTR